MELDRATFRDRLRAAVDAVLGTHVERSMLDIVDRLVTDPAGGPVALPWRPGDRELAVLARAARRKRGAQALERLWFFWSAQGLVDDTLRLADPRPGRSVEFAPADFRRLAAADAIDDAIWLEPLPSERTEDRYLAEAAVLLARAAQPARLLAALARLNRAEIDWGRGQLALDLGRGRSSLLCLLNLPARLGLGRLELYYRARPQARPADARGFLPARWRGRRLADLVRRWLRDHRWDGTVEDYLRVLRLRALLNGPAIFAHIAAGRVPAGRERRTSGPRRVRQARQPSPPPSIEPVAPDGSRTDEALAQVSLVLRRLRAGLGPRERLRLAKELDRLRPALGASEDPPTTDAVITEFAILLLRSPRLRPNTVRTSITGLYRLSEELSASIVTLTAEERAELYADLISEQGTADSQQTMKTRFRRLDDFLCARHGVPLADWHGPELAVPGPAGLVVLVTPEEVERLPDVLAARWPADAEALSLAADCWYWFGLRRMEAANLTIQDVRPGPWGTIRIDRAKTRAGCRAVPGGLLAPWAWRRLEAYRATRLVAADTEQAPLFVTARGEPWDPDELGRRIGLALCEVTGHEVSPHALRKGFANTSVLRWGVACGQADWPQGWGPVPEVAGLVTVLGDDDSLMLDQLRAVMGHAGAGVTVARYLAMDVVRAAWRSQPTSGRLRAGLAVDLLQCSRQAMYKQVRPIARGEVDGKDVLRVQLRRLLPGEEPTA